VVMVAVVVGVSTNQLDASNSGTGHQSANLWTKLTSSIIITIVMTSSCWIPRLLVPIKDSTRYLKMSG
jgi:hypothetical protein